MAFGIDDLILLAASSALAYLLRARVKRPTAPEFDIPKAEQGTPVPIVYGTQAVPIIVTASGEIEHHDGDEGSTPYSGLVVADLCVGEITEIVDIQFGGRSLRLHPVQKNDSADGQERLYAVTTVAAPTAPGLPYTFTSADSITFDINARQLFGGDKIEGGIEHHIRIHRGSLTDTVDPVLAHLWDAADLPGGGTANPGVATITFGEVSGATITRFYWGTVPQPKPPVVIVRVIPNALGLGAIGINANPAEIVYDLLTHPIRGRGLDASLIDADSFVRCGSVLAAEALGLSFTFSRQQETQDMIEDVGHHIHGDCYQSAITGLWTMVLAREDYLRETLIEVTRQTATDLVVTRPSWRPTTNEMTVTYRKYDDTPLTEQTVTDEPLTPGLHFLPPFDLAYYQAKGRFITAVTVTNVTKSTTLTLHDHYEIVPSSGVIWFRHIAGETDEGDVITVSYTNGAELVGYVEATELAQDLANQQATGEVRAETIERPGFTDPLTASVHAWRALKLKARPLAQATWTATRADALIVPGDVRALTWTPEGAVEGDFALDRVPFRIVKVDYGELANGKIRVTAVEDVFGASVAPSLAVDGNPPPIVKTAPPIAAIYCLGADEVALQASDVNFPIHLQRADDTAGTGAEDVAESPLPGTTTSYTDATTGKTHRGRLIRAGWLDGPWTAWVGPCTDGAPDCVLPTITDSVLTDGLVGTLAVSIDDPQLRLAPADAVQFRVTTADGTVGAWTTDDALPYEQDVALVASQTAYIARRVTFHDCDGNLTVAEAEYPFTVPIAPPPDPGVPAILPIEIVLLGASDAHEFAAVPADVTVLRVETSSMDKYPLGGFVAARIVVVVEETSLVSPAAVLAEFEAAEAPDVWGPLDGDAGPSLAIDATSIGTDLGKAVSGDWVTIRAEALQDVRIRGVLKFGDDDPDKLVSLPRVVLQLKPFEPLVPPPSPLPPPVNPGSCDTPSPLDIQDHDSQVEPAGSVWSTDGADELLTLDGTGSGEAQQQQDRTGLEVDEQYTSYVTVESDAAIEVFFGVVGGVRSTTTAIGTTTLSAQGLTDGSGNQSLEWGVTAIEAAPDSAGSDDLSYADAAAATTAGYTVAAGSGTITFDTGHAITGSGLATSVQLHVIDSGTAPQFNKDFTVVSGQVYIVKVWAQLDGGWFHPAGLALTSGANTRGSNLNGGQTKHLSATITADGTTLNIKFQNPRSSLFGGTANLWVAGLTIDGLSGGGAEIRFSDLGSCLGTGLPDPDPEPPPDPPPPLPPPATSDRYLGAFHLPIAGLGAFNSTVVILTPANARNVINAAMTAGTRIYAFFGSQDQWLDPSGTYSLARHKAIIALILGQPGVATAMAAAIALGLFVNFHIDEPFVRSTRYGGTIPIGVVEQGVLYVKSFNDDIPTMISVRPVQQAWWLTRHINGLDYVEAEYSTIYGEDCATFVDQNLARAAVLLHGCLVGPHLRHIDHPSDGGRYATSDEWRRYGSICASRSSNISILCWEYYAPMFNQAGWWEATNAVADVLAANDP